jgi:fido (protein-threonine AMPylation protein)
LTGSPPLPWKYENHSNADVLVPRAETIQKRLLSGVLDTEALLMDTRPVHAELFKGLTPKGCAHFAGHYRGENFDNLRDYSVIVPADFLVGNAAPAVVPRLINEFSSQISETLLTLDSLLATPLAEGERERHVTRFASKFFERFLTIHPYVNGNGHVARFLLLAFLSRYGFWLRKWPIHPTGKLEYGRLISMARRGIPEAVSHEVLKALEHLPAEGSKA